MLRGKEKARNYAERRMRKSTCRGVIDYASPSLQSVIGWQPEELASTRVLDLIQPDDVAEIERALRESDRDAGRQPVAARSAGAPQG